jgi:hypothetical protein
MEETLQFTQVNINREDTEYIEAYLDPISKL